MSVLMDAVRASAEREWRRLVEEAGLQVDQAEGRYQLVAGDGRRLTEADLWERPTQDLVSWATAHLRIPTMGEISAVAADEGEG